MDEASIEREIIRLWNALRLREKEGRPTALIRRALERAVAERDRRVESARDAA